MSGIISGFQGLEIEYQRGQDGKGSNSSENYGKPLPWQIMGLSYIYKPDCGPYPFNTAKY